MSGILLVEDLVVLFGDFLKELAATNVLHDEVDVFFVNIRLIVLDNIRVIQLREYVNFLLYCLEVILQFGFIHHFNGYFVLPIMLVESEKHFAEGAGAENDGVVIYLVVLLQFSSSLLLL